jgi:hypothetical protein
MPKSRVRKKDKAFVSEKVVNTPALPTESPKWLAPTMVAAFIAGLIWIVIFYVSATKYPIPHIGAWNMVCGFGFIAFGFSLATRWR